MSKTLRRIVYKSGWLGKLLGNFTSSFQFGLLSFYKDEEIVKLIRQIKKDIAFAFFPSEAYMIYSIAKSQSKLEGDMAEVGVYQGGSAKLICAAKGDRKLHLFDTFQGLPEVSDKDTHFGTKFWKDHEFANTSQESVTNYLSSYTNFQVYKGEFPSTAKPIENSKFSFVHLDVDLYKSTLDCLVFFYPRLVQGGIILTHDYHTEGVKTAFQEFFQEKKIPVVELSGPQCMIVKN